MSAGAAGRILDSANPRETRAHSRLCPLHCHVCVIAAKTRENTASVTKEHKFPSGNRGNMCVEEF